MTSKISKWAICFAVVALGYIYVFSPLSGSENLLKERSYCTASIERIDDKQVMKFTIYNSSNQSLKIPTASLPWGIRSSRILIAVNAYTGQILREPLAVEDSGGEITNLESKKSIKGQLVLNEIFPDLEKNLEKYDVIIFWSYQLEPYESKAFSRFCGSIVLTSVQKH